MLDTSSIEFTIKDLEQILDACWNVGACNLSGLANDLPDACRKARNEHDRVSKCLAGGDIMITNYMKHPVIQLMLGHMSYLAGISLGPEPEVVAKVEDLLALRKAALITSNAS